MLKYEFLTPWWCVLQPYYPQLVADNSSIYGDSNKIGRLSVHVQPQRPAGGVDKPIRDNCQELRDALELVFLFSVVDRTAFVEMASGYLCGRKSPQQIDWALPRAKGDDDTVRCHVELHPTYLGWVAVHETHEWIRTAMAILFTPQRLQDRAQSFQKARDTLLSFSSRPPRSLEICVGVTVHNAIVPALSSIVRGFAHTPVVDGYPFRVAVVGVQSVLDPVFLAQLDACLRNTGRCCLRLGNVLIRTDKLMEQVSYGHQLSVLLRPSVEPVATSAAPTSPGASLEAATSAHPLLLRQLCSALMYCQDIDSLTINWGPGDRRRAGSRVRLQQMQWIAVALFSRWASHGIRHVHLRRFKLTRDECDELRQLLQLPNPIASPLGLPPVEPNGRSHQVLVERQTELGLHQPVTTRHPKCVRLSETSWLDVVVDDVRDVEHCDVLVPAFGVCRLKRVDSRAQRPRAHAQSLARITSLTLDVLDDWRVTTMDTDQRNGLCAFLGVVGTPLTALSVIGVLNFTSCLDAVWDHCPSLQCLQLTSVSSAILAALLDAYETGVCRVTSLDLRRVLVEENGTDVVQFFDALADATRKITQTLGELTFGLERAFVRYSLTRAEMRAAAQMLETNTTLASFVVGLDVFENRELVATCVLHHGQRLPKRKTPLQARAKLAFLSVVVFGGGSSRSSGETARPHLGSDVITLIFDMAAQSLTRKVKIVDGPYF